MKPSDIHIGGMMPLTGTFGRVEAEAAAALIVGTLAATDDQWRPIDFSEMGTAKFPHLPWMHNPFVRPEIDELVERGYATLSDDRKTAELTDKALDVLRASRWNKSREQGET